MKLHGFKGENMKKEYEAPKLTIEEVSVLDIIALSSVDVLGEIKDDDGERLVF